MPVMKVLLIALSLAIDVFAVSIGIGIRQSDLQARLRFAVAFICAELSMTLVGTLLGAIAQRLLGDVAGYIGFVALIGVGIFVLLETQKTEHEALDLSRGFGLVLSAMAVSLDSLGIGFSMQFIHVSLPLMFAAIALCTCVGTFAGFALGRRLGAAFEERAEFLAGSLLIITGLVFVVMKYTGHG